jgi:hypothetical protein
MDAKASKAEEADMAAGAMAEAAMGAAAKAGANPAGAEKAEAAKAEEPEVAVETAEARLGVVAKAA